MRRAALLLALMVPAHADVARHIEQARIAEARVILADARGQSGTPAHADLARLNQALAAELIADLQAGRLSALETFAKAVEGDRPAGRGAFHPAWAQVKAALRDPRLRGKLSASRLQYLEWRIEASLNAPGVVGPPRRTEAPPPAPAQIVSSSLTFTPPVRVSEAPPSNVVLPHLEDDAPPVRSIAPGASLPAGDGLTLVIADFTENGYRTGAAMAAADLLARALADSGRFRVLRASGGPPAAAPGLLVEADLSPVRVFASPNPYYGAGFGYFGNNRRGGRRFFPYPYTYTNDVTYSFDARVRVSDLATRARIGEKTVSGFTSSYLNSGYSGLGLGGYGYGPTAYSVSAGGPAAQVVEQAMIDKRSGASRFILDLVPVTGRVARVDGPKSAVVELAGGAGVHAGDRFVVLGGGGQEVAVLRAQEQVAPGSVRVTVSGHDDDGPVPRINPGDSVVSRGY